MSKIRNLVSLHIEKFIILLLIYFFLMGKYTETLAKIHQLHKLNPQIKIIPTHYLKTWLELEKILV